MLRTKRRPSNTRRRRARPDSSRHRVIDPTYALAVSSTAARREATESLVAATFCLCWGLPGVVGALAAAWSVAGVAAAAIGVFALLVALALAAGGVRNSQFGSRLVVIALAGAGSVAVAGLGVLAFLLAE